MDCFVRLESIWPGKIWPTDRIISCGYEIVADTCGPPAVP